MTGIEGFGQIRGGYPFYTSKKDNIANEETFADTLTETADNDILKKAPDKWVTEPGISFNAMKAALEFRRNELGIEDTEPTYEFTPEQREWLNSRHDFPTMQMYVRYSFDYGGTTQYRTEATAEYSNFVADLVYLGVYSPDDFLQLSPLDTRPGANSVLTEYVNKVQNSDGSLLSTTRLFVEHL